MNGMRLLGAFYIFLSSFLYLSIDRYIFKYDVRRKKFHFAAITFFFFPIPLVFKNKFRVLYKKFYKQNIVQCCCYVTAIINCEKLYQINTTFNKLKIILKNYKTLKFK